MSASHPTPPPLPVGEATRSSEPPPVPQPPPLAGGISVGAEATATSPLIPGVTKRPPADPEVQPELRVPPPVPEKSRRPDRGMMPADFKAPRPLASSHARPAPAWIRAAALVLPLMIALGALIAWLAGHTETTSASDTTAVVVPSREDDAVAVAGLLVVDAAPWGEVTRVISATGEGVPLPARPYTPLALELPPGSYVVELSHPEFGTQACEVDVAVGNPGRCRIELLQMNAKQYLEEAGWWR